MVFYGVLAQGDGCSVKGLIQRVSAARVVVDQQVVGEIDRGILLLLGIDKDDTESHADKLIKKVLKYRIFPDDNDKMNLSLSDICGGLLVVSQFTLAADTGRGLRPSFSCSAHPDDAKLLYDYTVGIAKQQHNPVASGQFGADMKVHLVNDGPVTFMLES